MDAWEIGELVETREQAGPLYHEFLRVSALSVGLYVLPAGGVDPQGPHTEDEVYYIVSGRGMIRVAEEERPVQAGSVIFVAAGAPHRFFDIEEELRIVVFFAPAEYTLG